VYSREKERGQSTKRLSTVRLGQPKILKIGKADEKGTKKNGCQDVGSEDRMWPGRPIPLQELFALFVPLTCHYSNACPFSMRWLVEKDNTDIGVPTSPTTED
jgi:hypothetical protein